MLTRVGVCPSKAVQVPGRGDLLDEVERVQEMFRDAHEGEEDGGHSNLDQQSCPSSSTKRVPCLACPALQQVILSEHGQKLPGS